MSSGSETERITGSHIGIIRLQKKFGATCVSISCDSYYKGLGPNDNPENYNFDHPSAIDFELMAEHLRQIKVDAM